MKVLVVYDSVFGNTEKIAQAIGGALAAGNDAATLRVNDVKLEQLKGINLLIIGSPTRGFRPTEGITNFLQSIPGNSLNGIPVAAFDTRLKADESSFLTRLVLKGGYAAKTIANLLVKNGGNLVTPPEGFFVKDREGPLKDGELERAAAWAGKIASLVSYQLMEQER